MDTVTLGICQFFVTDDKEKNLTKAGEMIKIAADQGAEMIALPESFSCPYDLTRFPSYAEDVPTGETASLMAETAAKYRVWLVAGSIPEREGGALYNTSMIFSPQGELAAKYRKVHLFDIDIPGRITFRESLVFTAGQSPVVIRDAPIPFGVAICYDIRFPEWFRLMTQQGAELVLVPAVFSPVTGPAHWELLLRTRAVDNQVYMAGIAQAPNRVLGFKSYGHSMVSDPWGEVTVSCGEEESVFVCTIDRERIREVRKQLPLMKNLRHDCY